MDDVRDLQALQLDALREVANIGAGHAATALGQMVNSRIMISVPRVNILRLEEVPELLGQPDDPIAAIMMHMLGDLTGRTLVIFPVPSAQTLCDILSAGPPAGRRSSARWRSRGSRRPATSSRAPT